MVQRLQDMTQSQLRAVLARTFAEMRGAGETTTTGLLIYVFEILSHMH